MAVSIGKRKREQDDESSIESSDGEDTMRACFEKAFEAKFTPLPPSEKVKQPVQDIEVDMLSDESDDLEWDGLSDDEGQIEVIKHDLTQPDDYLDEMRERRSFMVQQ